MQQQQILETPSLYEKQEKSETVDVNAEGAGEEGICGYC